MSRHKQNGKANDAALVLGSRSNVRAQATGPQTISGKRRSSQNALKHGIFSRTILLKDESPN